MTWSLQLTPWALPPLLAVLVIVRELAYLWPRRREPGTRTLMFLAAAGGLWAAVDLVGILSASLPVKIALARAAYLPAAAATVAWPVFALDHADRKGPRPKSVLAVFVVAAITAGVALGLGPTGWLFQDPELVPVGQLVGLSLVPGILFWAFQGAQFLAVGLAIYIISPKGTRGGGSSRQMPAIALAGAAALLPAVYHLVASLGQQWADISSSGYALGTAFLAWGLLRPRLRNLGPVDHSRVVHELLDPMVIFDGKGRIVDVNRAAARDLGLEPYGRVPVDLGTLWAAGTSEIRGPRTFTSELPDGDEHIFEVTVTPLGDPGTDARSALLLRDVTAREKMRAELERLANTDVLTGLANRRNFLEVLGREMERSGRYARPLSLILLDLDYFKKVNDTHGHAAGDDVLRAAARVLRAVGRDVDLPARVGGEELAMLLPETDSPGAEIVAERVREGIQRTEHRSPAGKAFSVTASIGVASVDVTGGDTGDSLLQKADEALYRAKRGGRNRVITSSKNS